MRATHLNVINTAFAGRFRVERYLAEATPA